MIVLNFYSSSKLFLQVKTVIDKIANWLCEKFLSIHRRCILAVNDFIESIPTLIWAKT